MLVYWSFPVIGYTIYYSTRDSPDMSDWIIDILTGDDLTRTILGLTSDTVYYFKIRAHTSKGEGPVSDVVSHRTPGEGMLHELCCCTSLYIILCCILPLIETQQSVEVDICTSFFLTVIEKMLA